MLNVYRNQVQKSYRSCLTPDHLPILRALLLELNYHFSTDQKVSRQQFQHIEHLKNFLVALVYVFIFIQNIVPANS